MSRNKNIYLPFKAKIKEIFDTGHDVRLFKIIPPRPPFNKGGARGDL
jgi:hypothetical protein